MITLIKIENITKSYSKNENEKILKGISINFGETGFVTILGKSGSGKTTLLNIIGGLDKGKGTIYYDDTKIKKYNSKIIDLYRSKHVGYVFQNYLLMQDLTVYENLDVALSLSGINNKNERKKRIDKCLKAVGMDRYKRRVSSALSGGQQQRVAIARALVKNTDVLICDEPTGNLDSVNSKAIMNILRGISKHRLVILVTHNEDLAYQYSDRIIRLVDGKIESDKQNTSSINAEQHNVIDKSKLQKEQINDGNLSVDLFTDQKSKDIKLSIISYENKLRIVVESGQNMLDDRYQIVEKIVEKQEDSDIDISFTNDFDNKKEKTKLLSKISKSFSRVTNIKKGKKALYHGFFIFGILISIMLYLFQSFDSINRKMGSYLGYDNQFILFENRDSDVLKTEFTKQEIIDVIKNPDSGMASTQPVKVNLFQMKNILVTDKIPSGKPGYPDNTYYTSVDVIYQSQYKKYFKSVKYGHLPQKENEIIVSTKVIDSLMIYYLPNYDLIDYKDYLDSYLDFGTHYDKYYISGIVESDLVFIGCNDSTYIEFLNASLTKIPLNDHRLNFADTLSETLHVTKDNYISTHDFTLSDIDDAWLNKEYNDSMCNYYMTKKFYYDYYYSYPSHNSGFNCRGILENDQESMLVYESPKDYEKFLDIFSSEDSKYYFCYKSIDTLDKEKIYYLDSNYTPEFGDIVISKTLYENSFKFPYGKVVGYFDNNGLGINDMYMSNSFAEVLYSTPENIYTIPRDYSFISNDFEKTKTFFEENYGLKAVDKNQYMNENTNAPVISAFFVIVIILLIISGLFIYLMNRSKMIKNIYTIGVYRSIGVKKSVIYKVFMLDSILVTTITMALGYTLASLVILYLGKVFLFDCLSWWMYIIGLVAIYGVNLFSSLLPLFILLRKTPREITIKYDI